jgi:hypothetical protein
MPLYIKDNKALAKLNASDNSMFGENRFVKRGIRAWADAIKSNTAITELNLAKNCMDEQDAKILCPAISGNGALTSLDLAGNHQISRHYDSDRNEMVATPKGTPCGQLYLSCAYIRSLCRPCCYR